MTRLNEGAGRVPEVARQLRHGRIQPAARPGAGRVDRALLAGAAFVLFYFAGQLARAADLWGVIR